MAAIPKNINDAPVAASQILSLSKVSGGS